MKTLLKIFMVLLTMHLGYTNLQAEEWNWAKQAGGVWEDSGEAICTDNQGNVYAVGKFSGIAQFGDFSIQTVGGFDIYITKMDKNGNFLWAKRAGGNGGDVARGVAVDSEGNVVVVGTYRSNNNNNATFGHIQVSGGGLFVTKLDSEGNFLWVSRTDGNVAADGFAVDLDQNDNIYVTGVFQSTVTFGNYTLNGTESSQGTAFDAAFITKLNNEGTFLWAKSIEVPEDGWLVARSYSIKADPEGNNYIAGYYDGTAIFGETTLDSYSDGTGSFNVFITKLNSEGEFVWANHATLPNDEAQAAAYAHAIAIDSDQNVYITGEYQGTPKFGTTVLAQPNYINLFVAKLNSSGQFLWALGNGADNENWGSSIVVDNEGYCYVGGKWGHWVYGYADEIQYSITFGSQTFTKNHTGPNAFVTKISSHGEYVWAKSVSTHGSPSGSYTNALAADNYNNIYATGFFLRTANFDSFSFTSFEMNDVPLVDIWVGRIGDNNPPNEMLTFSVKANSQPISNATIAINQEELATNSNGLASVTLPFASYAYTVTHPNYKTYNAEINFQEETTVNLVLESNTTSSESHLANGISLYPNPFKDVIYIANYQYVNSIMINTSTGTNVLSQPLSSNTLNTSRLNKGVYIVTVFLNNGEKQVFRLVKQ
ncbi:MAG: T9SS type A sorting domain-containing protein [Bacteroidales bacterium]|nr:T9SS type A sorting domain-containing protein [Bacteroidales bacterium]MBN2748882.1 T9SS type A sorting domain-containing protein [Bacteroidales bacterium]